MSGPAPHPVAIDALPRFLLQAAVGRADIRRVVAVAAEGVLRTVLEQGMDPTGVQGPQLLA